MSTPRDDFDVIVVGSGIGGAAAAVSLAHARKRVLVLEKNKRVGGSCSYYEKEGFHVDVGTHMFCRAEKGPLGDVLRRVGAPTAIRFERALPGILRGFDFDVRLTASPVATVRALVEAIRQAGIPPRELANAARFFHAILTMPAHEVDRLDRVSMYEFILRYTRDPHVYILFNFLLGLYFILSPKDVSAGEAIWSFQRFIRDHALSYPRGGASAIPETYLRLAGRYGAKVRTGAGVKRIVVEGGVARGVEIDDGSVVRARAVISTAGLRDAVRMAGPEQFSSEFRARVAGLKGSQIAVQAKIGLRRRLVDAAWIVGGTPLRFPPGEPTIETFNGFYDSVARGRVGSGVPIYCPVPTHFDPSLAPEGCQLLTACALAPTTDIPLEDQEGYWIERMMETLYEMIPGLREETPIFCDTFGVKFIAHWIGKEGGAAVTTGQCVGQVGADRPSVRSELDGLYFAGDCAGARGVGTELAAASGMECADVVLADLSRDFRAPVPRDTAIDAG